MMRSTGAAQPVRVVIASDGKRGHQNQNAVVAQMIGDPFPLVMELRDPEGGLCEKLLRAHFSLFGARYLSRRASAALVRHFLRPSAPEEFRQFAGEIRSSRQSGQASAGSAPLRVFTLSSGTPPATMNLLLASLLDARAVVNMTPSMLPLNRFELALLPQHDASGRPAPVNAIVSPLAVGKYDPTQAAHVARMIRERSAVPADQPCFGLALGGPSRSASWDRDTLVASVSSLLKACKEGGLSVLATTSRRTPKWMVQWLRTEAQSLAQIPFLLDASADPLNPLPGMYTMCQGIAITADSFSMASEAVHAGHLPLLIRPSQRSMRRKLEDGLASLVNRGWAVWYRQHELLATSLAASRPQANAEYERVRSLVRVKLGLP